MLAANLTETDPNGLAPDAPGAKLDDGKVRPWLMMSGFSRALKAVAEVTTKGAIKYSPNGWMYVENGEERYMEAYGRHALDLGAGKVYDDGPKGTGCRHKAQMIWNLMASLELELRAEEEMARLHAIMADAQQHSFPTIEPDNNFPKFGTTGWQLP